MSPNDHKLVQTTCAIPGSNHSGDGISPHRTRNLLNAPLTKFTMCLLLPHQTDRQVVPHGGVSETHRGPPPHVFNAGGGAADDEDEVPVGKGPKGPKDSLAYNRNYFKKKSSDAFDSKGKNEDQNNNTKLGIVGTGLNAAAAQGFEEETEEDCKAETEIEAEGDEVDEDQKVETENAAGDETDNECNAVTEIEADDGAGDESDGDCKVETGNAAGDGGGDEPDIDCNAVTEIEAAEGGGDELDEHL
jgi:hypothetical protein